MRNTRSRKSINQEVSNEELLKMVLRLGPCSTFGSYNFMDVIAYVRNYVPNMKGESKVSYEDIIQSPYKYWEEAIELITENKDEIIKNNFTYKSNFLTK